MTSGNYVTNSPNAPSPGVVLGGTLGGVIAALLFAIIITYLVCAAWLHRRSTRAGNNIRRYLYILYIGVCCTHVYA